MNVDQFRYNQTSRDTELYDREIVNQFRRNQTSRDTDLYDREIVNQFRRNQTSRDTDLYDPVVANQLSDAVEDERETHAGENEAKYHQDDDDVLLFQRVRQSSSLRLQKKTMKTL